MSTCSTCGAEILWALTPAGKRIPLDPEPVAIPRGLVELEFQYDPPRSRPAQQLWQSHFASCPDADQHRRKEVS